MKNIYKIIMLLPALFISCSSNKQIYRAGSYEIFRDRIIQQNKFTAKAVSPAKIISDYKSQGFLYKSPVINFKFSINGSDNEMPTGVNHSFLCMSGNGDSLKVPLIKFGDEFDEKRTPPTGLWLPANIPVSFRVDMSNVFDAFDRQGYFITSTGKKIFKEDFKGVFLAGNVSPLSWDFDNLPRTESMKMKEKEGHIFELNVLLNPIDKSQYEDKTWNLKKDISAFPSYKCSSTLENAIYNLSLEEMCKAVEPDSTFRTGKEWAGVWTRDISYSIILSMAYMQPEVSMKSLMKKVNSNNRIIQDTGTGGAWPISSDRMIWAIAAYEIYKVTGNRKWLETIYPVIRNSVEDDLMTIYDRQTGLMKGESSFLDWREQEYPRWMQPADIFQSENLGTSAVHCKALRVLSEISSIMGKKDDAEHYLEISENIKSGINKQLWMDDKGFYGQYLYGRNSLSVSPRSETLGEALCVLFGIADKNKSQRLIASVPSVDFGTPCFFPNIPDIPPYHNDGIWPFVQSYWMWASAKSGNENGVLHSIGAIYRASAMFLTNQENFVASTGDWFGTQINSANMLWSLSGNISIVHHLLFGIRFKNDGMAFEPFVPKSMAGKRSLNRFRYRDAYLDIDLDGWGNKISSFKIDGKEHEAFIPEDIKGDHKIKIVLSCSKFSEDPILITANRHSPETPATITEGRKIKWAKISNATSYKILTNGKIWRTTTDDSISIPEDTEGEIQVIAVDGTGLESFASEPVSLYNKAKIYEAEDFCQKSNKPYKDYSGTGFVEISKDLNRTITIPVKVDNAGKYSIDWHYSNGNGPINTENKCAIRSFFVDGKLEGVFVFPQRGTNMWNIWGWSNPIQLELNEGTHLISLEFMTFNENMNLSVNQAMLDYLRITHLK